MTANVARCAILPLGTRTHSMHMTPEPPDSSKTPTDPGFQPRLAETRTLLHRAADGDAGALEALCARYLPRLRSWATRRLPDSARYRMDTEDLVQEVMVGTIQNIEKFEPEHANSFLAYLRQGFMHRVGSEIRNAKVRREHAEEQAARPGAANSPDPSPLDELVGQQTLELYEAALERMSPEDQDLIMARVELGLTYKEIALYSGRPSEDAVRMATRRALLKLAEAMGHEA
jgi:RNA polymerase sigma factor (sigma-70 family)